MSETDSKKLLIVIGSMNRGGAERVISHISNYMAKKGWKVYICLLLFPNVSYDLDSGIEIIDLSGNTHSRIKRLPMWISRLRQTIKRIQPDTVLSFAARINIITMISSIGIKCKKVLSERNDPFMDGRSKVVDMATSLVYPKADTIVFQTKRALSYFNKINLKNAIIIGNPVSVKCMAGTVTKGKIVSVGRLTNQKNQKMLIEAFNMVAKNNDDVKLYIYGEGELRSILTEQIKSYGLENRVFLPGNVENIHECIKDANAFVLSSDYEGLSNALLEALMMGLQCISTNCAGSDEVIEDGVNGWLVNVGDVESLVDKMEKVISGEIHVEKKDITETVKGYKLDLVMREWEEAFLVD